MKYQNIVIFLAIPIFLFSILSLLGNIQAQTSSTNQAVPQKGQALNFTVQALMQIDIEDLKDSLTDAKAAIVNGNFEEALTTIRDVETQLLLLKPQPIKFLNDLHKVTNTIARSDIDKSLDGLTSIQITILKAENQIFKTAITNPQWMQKINDNQQETDEEEYTDIEDT